MRSKKWYTSKFIYAGIVQVIIGSLDLLAVQLQNNTLVNPLGWVLFASGVFTLVNRYFFTDVPISK
jgi:uncharacterized membrane protein HdeD (DUF308 family)